MATTGTFVLYESFSRRLAEDININTDTFRMLLTTSSYTPNAATHSVLADITNEVSGNGYARQALTQTVTRTGNVTKFDVADPVFTASGGSITARYFVIFDDTVTGDALVGYGLIDNTPADSVTADGNTLTGLINAGGLFTIAFV